jgi:hypothetical protein
MLNHQKQAALSALWIVRLRHLKTALEQSPNSVQAWHWRAQVKVLRFMISRYGDQTDVPTLPPKNQPLLHFEVPKWPNPPKPRGKLRKILKRIKKTNELKPNEPMLGNTLPDSSPAPLFKVSDIKPETERYTPTTLLEKILLADIPGPTLILVVSIWGVLLFFYLVSRQ